MNYRLTIKVLGYMLMVEALTMLIPVLVALLYGESPMPFLYVIALAAGIGYLMSRIKKGKKGLRVRDGFMTVGLAWVLLSFFGALPFVFSGEIPNIIDAFFECVSGFTTTGSSILTDVEALSRASLFWRSFTHWLGGMGVLVFALAIMPTIGGSTQLMRAESPGPSPEKLVPRVGETAKVLYGIYIVMTIAIILVLFIAGMPLFDSFCHGFGTAGTGGFSIYNDSYAHYNNALFEAITTIGMVLFGVNFTVYYKISRKNIKGALKSQEMLFYFLIVIVAMASVSISIIPMYNGSVGEAVRQGTFAVASVMSTTGYASGDFNLWPQIARTILLVLMFLGTCAGSTGGGIKTSRLVLILKKIKAEIYMLLHPRAVRRVTMDGRVVDDEIIQGILNYLAMYILVVIGATIIVSFDNMSFEGTFSSVMATLNNIGPGLAEVGPTSNFAGLSYLSKATLTLCMLIGRLEILPILLLFTPSAWKRA